MIKKIVCITVSLLMSSSFAAKNAASVVYSNFEKPERIAKKILGKSEKSAGKVVQYCHVYDDLAVIEVKDPGVMGASSLVFHPIVGGNASKACNPDDKTHSYDVKAEGYFVGKFQRYVFTQGPDCFGRYCPFQLFYASDQNYRLILQGTVAADKRIEFIKQPTGKIGLEYWVGVKSSCSLVDKEKQHCWRKVLRKGKLGWLPLPDCSDAYRQQQVSLSTPSQVIVHMQIPDLRNPTVDNIVNEQVECFPQP